MQMHPDEVHEKYIDIVACNWSIAEYNGFAQLARREFYKMVMEDDGREDGVVFCQLWENNFTINEEICLTGEATSIISHPIDDT